MPHALGHGEGAGAHVHPPPPCALGVHRRPPPGGRACEALDRLVLAAPTVVDVPQPGRPRIARQWLPVHLAAKGARKGPQLLRGRHQPVPYGVGIARKAPGGGAEASALSHARQHADDQCHGPLLARKERAMMRGLSRAGGQGMVARGRRGCHCARRWPSQPTARATMHGDTRAAGSQCGGDGLVRDIRPVHGKARGEVPSRAHTGRQGAFASDPPTLWVRWRADVVASWAWLAAVVTRRMG
jgi:hypothetical protein